jgi:hypothetical protein
VEKYLGNGNNIRFESPQRLIKQIAWPDPGLRFKTLNLKERCYYAYRIYQQSNE